MDNEENVPPNTHGKRKRQSLTFDEKLAIIKRAENGENFRSISQSYGIGKSTVGLVVKNREKICVQQKILAEKNPKRASKRFKAVDNSLMEKILFSWISQSREAGVPISGPVICERALQISRDLFDDSNFKASSGWLHNFMKRFGIRQLSIQGEKLSADTNSSDMFVKDFRQFIESEGYDANHIYNADETGLQWKALPDKTLASWTEKSAEGFKVAKERVTIMTCANASGCHKISLLMIGKFKKPRCFKGLRTLPLVYTNQRNAWMDKTVFVMWYTSVFLPAIKSTRNNEGERFLLLLDNAPSHPSAEELNAIDPCCTVKYLPPNVTSLIQPMDQGVIVALKRHYKKRYLRELLINNSDSEINYKTFYRAWTLNRCIEQVSMAWESLTNDTLRKAWNKLIPQQYSDNEENEVAEIAVLANRALQTRFSIEETVEWLENDQRDHGWQVQSFRQIMANITGIADEQNNDDEEEEEEEGHVQVDTMVTAEKAYKDATLVMNWLMTEGHGSPEDIRIDAQSRDVFARLYTAEKMSESHS